MKKIAIFLLIIIGIVSTVAYVYLNNVANYKNAQKENIKFEVYKDQEIYGAEVSTLINRAMDSNQKNEIEKDKNGRRQFYVYDKDYRCIGGNDRGCGTA